MTAGRRYLIIHGHFYQPPRENPWVMAIEPQDSAAPFRDWNERINRECYAPNCRSRLLDGSGQIVRLINNYERLSFNFGPTLLSWLEKADPVTYGRIIAADQKAAAARGGHGPALAQVFNHIIMPLANSRDRLTQIRWGLADFEHRFGRRPEGMWLAETAVDLETLKMLAAEGLKFTVLAQGQAQAVRPLGGGENDWEDVSGGRVDPREPYRVVWGQGPNDHIDVFFYDGPVSRAIAFEELLRDGTSLLSRIETAFGQERNDGRPRLVNLATDGESYGHHFKFGDMALAWLFNHLEERSGQADAIELTNYGHYLSLFPPVREARVIDNTSWSCAHGVERWRSDCGCNTGGGHGAWNQKWRKPLRDGLNLLRDKLASIFEQQGGAWLKDPWAARNDYIKLLIAHYDGPARDEFLKKHQSRELEAAEITNVLSLLESQVMGLFMFTSCGWFFDEISGLEPVQNLRYALRAIDLAQKFTNDDLSAVLLNQLETISPNDAEYSSGGEVWRRLVIPDRLTARTIAAHWVSSRILNVPEAMRFFNIPHFTCRKEIRLTGENISILATALDLEDPRLAWTDSKICLAIYSGSTHLAALVGENNFDGGQPIWLDQEKLKARLGNDLHSSAALSIWETMVELMPMTSRYVLEDMLPHCRATLLSTLVNDVYDDLKNHARDIFHRNQHLLMMSRGAGQPITWEERFIFRVMGESELRRILAPAEHDASVNLPALTHLMTRRGLIGLAKEEPIIAELGRSFFKNEFKTLADSKTPRRLLNELTEFVKLIETEHFKVDLWELQNQWHSLAAENQDFIGRLAGDDLEALAALGEALGFSPDFLR
ncbi:DUF3536 domain-containing protein [Deltaproteobacteria bacterium OttesenSCG-928-K17]|nr:DUF3536 domain-containing protein [Deltaproteobacteria bacterium OttesenSCG-928-K17]